MKKPILILLLIIFLALAFRIPAVLTSQSFWLDEIVSLEIAKYNIVDSWEYLKWENNPPLHYWFLHFWLKIFGQSEKALRFSSVLFNILSILAIYFLGRNLINSKVGLFASLLLSLSSYHLYLSMEARMYPMLIFFAILSCYFFWNVIKHQKRKDWILYIIFSVLTYYIHLTGLFLFISQNIYFIFYHYYLKRKEPKIINWLVSQMFILLLFSPWLINFILTHLYRFNQNAWYLHTVGSGFFIFQLPRSFFLLANQIEIIDLSALLLFSALFILSFVKFSSLSSNKKDYKINLFFSQETIFLLILFAVPVLIGFVFQFWVAKYYSVASTGCFLLLASGFNNLKLSKKVSYIVIIFIIVMFVSPGLQIMRINQHGWHKVANYVEQHEKPGDKILITTFIYQLPFSHYYHGQTEIVGYQPQGLEDDLLLKTVKYNWYAILTKENMPDLNKILEKNKRVIVVNPTTASLVHRSNLVLDWFVENNWKFQYKEQFGGFVRSNVLIFERPK